MKLAVIYWSGTGNTEEMAKFVVEGAKLNGAEVDMYAASEFLANMVSDYNSFAFGCPSMGAEVLEETEFEPMFESVKNSIVGKPVALFGSYGWGDGQWMRDWEQECNMLGFNIISEPVIANDRPSEVDAIKCKELGAMLAQ